MLTIEAAEKLFRVFYNTNYLEFKRHMFVGFNDDYVFGMWENFKHPTRFWGSLDDDNKQAFLDWVNGV